MSARHQASRNPNRKETSCIGTVTSAATIHAAFDVSFLDAAEHVYDPTASGFDCRWLCTKEMSWELNPQKRHHRVTDLIADYHIGDTEEHRALADAIQEQMIYQALCREATTRGKWIER